MISLTCSCVALLLAGAAGLACAAGKDTVNIAEPVAALGMRQEQGGPVPFDYKAGHALPSAKDYPALHLHAAGDAAPDWRDLRSGLQRKLDCGWLLGLNYGRPLGAAAARDRSAAPAPRPDERQAFQNAGHRALVFSLARSF